MTTIRLHKMRVLKYYVENKAQLEAYVLSLYNKFMWRTGCNQSGGVPVFNKPTSNGVYH